MEEEGKWGKKYIYRDFIFYYLLSTMGFTTTTAHVYFKRIPIKYWNQCKAAVNKEYLRHLSKNCDSESKKEVKNFLQIRKYFCVSSSDLLQEKYLDQLFEEGCPRELLKNPGEIITEDFFDVPVEYNVIYKKDDEHFVYLLYAGFGEYFQGSLFGKQPSPGSEEKFYFQFNLNEIDLLKNARTYHLQVIKNIWYIADHVKPRKGYYLSLFKHKLVGEKTSTKKASLKSNETHLGNIKEEEPLLAEAVGETNNLENISRPKYIEIDACEFISKVTELLSLIQEKHEESLL